MNDNFKYVIERKNRSGGSMYYFWRDRRKQIRMRGEYGSDEFRSHYNDLIKSPRDRTVHNPDLPDPQLIERSIRRSITASKKRAREKGIAFDLDIDWALNKVREQGYRCALTGLLFFSKRGDGHRINPYTPSFDRIVPEDGYTKDNVRIVLLSVNIMILDWGDELFARIASRFLRARTKSDHTLLPQQVVDTTATKNGP